MARPVGKLKRLQDFLLRGLWEVERAELSRIRAFFLRQVQVASLVLHDFFADRCLLRASALTYATLLSLIPLLALMFAVLKGFGVQNLLEPIILEKLAVGSEEMVSQILRYIENTNAGRLGILGLAALLLTVLTLLSNIEKSFNFIWGVAETRPILRRFSDYFAVVTIGPIFVIAAISMTTTLQSHAVVARLQELAYVGELLLFLFKIIPYVGMWLVFTALYIFMPNCKVSYRAALCGGILGGTLWQLAQWGYVQGQVGVARYNAIYGTMAALPILMVWVYVSWLIVLLGLEFTYAWQNLHLVPSQIRAEQLNYSSRENMALAVVLYVGEAFHRGERPRELEEISIELGLPPRLARDVLGRLVRLGILSEVRDGGGESCGYQPGRDMESLPAYELLSELRSEGKGYRRLRPTPAAEMVAEIERRLQDAQRSVLEKKSLRDLVVESERKPTGRSCGG